MKTCLCKSFVTVSLLLLSHWVRAEQLPEFRPALPSHGRLSLVNLIDTNSLMKRGQGSATVMFSCGVSSVGNAGGAVYYRGTPNSDKLGQEIVRRCDQALFEPAVYNHAHTFVWIGGTVTFIVKDGKPHLRLFMNQEDDDLLTGRDFVAPQYVSAPQNYKFRGVFWPTNAPGHSGLAVVKLDVDAGGKVHGCHTVYEYPPGMGFGRETGAIRDAWFMPAFRDGKRVPCRFNWALPFEGPGSQMKTG